MKYICSWSGGKDSTASIILAHENNEPLDIIVFSEVKYDKKISGENPEHIDFVKNKAKPLFESWGYKVVILNSEKTYMDIFNHIMVRPRKHMHHKGQKYGFVLAHQCSAKRDLKLRPLADFYKTLKESYEEYVGIAVDEPTRLMSLHKDAHKVSLLEKYNYTTDMAKELCAKHGLLSPAYNYSKRGGCWFCPYAKLEEHQMIKKRYPKTWKRFVKLESQPNVAHNRWNVFGERLEERDKKL